MRRFITSIAALFGGVFLLFATPGSASGQELLLNANLDQGYAQEIVPDFFLPKPRHWINEGFRAISGPFEDEMSLEPWAGPAPTPVTTDGDAAFPNGVGIGADGGVFFKPFTGNANDGATTAHLYQDVPGTPGTTYFLSGWAGAEANAMLGDAVLALEFLDAGNSVIGGSVLSLLPTLHTPNGEPFNYKQYMVSGTAPDGTTMVRARVSMIGAMANPAGGGQAFVVDDFSLVIPEPAGLSVLSLAAAAVLARGRAGRRVNP